MQIPKSGEIQKKSLQLTKYFARLHLMVNTKNK